MSLFGKSLEMHEAHLIQGKMFVYSTWEMDSVVFNAHN